ncbi:MAG: hypothetical protein SF029_09305 [bacterium]|nr:hypothetical protein [bacterium]
MRVELDLRNLPLFRLMEYLTEAGGDPSGERTVTAARWQAEILRMEPVTITPILKVPRDLLVIEGDEDEVRRVEAYMRHKTMRGGG